MHASIVLLLLALAQADIQCRDKSGRAVDWWLIYKLPDMNAHESQLVKWGVGFLYLDPLVKEWDLGRVSLNRSTHPLAITLAQYYARRNHSDVFYALYNDDHPSEKKDSYRGHTKGVQLFDQNRGFWLVHSVPRFPDPVQYIYPQSGSVFAQSMICVSFYTQQSFASIAELTRLNQPSVYASNVPKWVQDDYPIMDEVIKKKSVRKGPFNMTAELRSAYGTKFTAFAKHKKWEKDLWADLVSPTLRSSLYVETWLNGPGDLPSECARPYPVMNLLSVAPDGIEFTNSKDHSKMAVSQDEREGWVCVGDINRQKSQDSRGGGALCLREPHVWRAYRAAALKVECCPGGMPVPRVVESRVVRSAAALADPGLGLGAAILALWRKIAA